MAKRHMQTFWVGLAIWVSLALYIASVTTTAVWTGNSVAVGWYMADDGHHKDIISAECYISGPVSTVSDCAWFLFARIVLVIGIVLIGIDALCLLGMFLTDRLIFARIARNTGLWSALCGWVVLTVAIELYKHSSAFDMTLDSLQFSYSFGFSTAATVLSTFAAVYYHIYTREMVNSAKYGS